MSMYREYINVVDTRRNKKPSQYDRDRLVRMIHIIVVLRSPGGKGQDDIILTISQTTQYDLIFEF